MKKMILLFVTFLVNLYIENGECLWKKGIVHYAINKKDYDLHSQEIIVSTLEKIQSEICVKFFNTPMNYSANEEDKILYISNADKRKDCPAEEFDFDETVVDMRIGYKCLNENDITRLIVDMLRASISIQGRPNTYDLTQDYKVPSALLSTKDRNFINSHYNEECGDLILGKPAPSLRRHFGSNIEMSPDNQNYYQDKLWPLGVVLYGISQDVALTKQLADLRAAMYTIEISSCVMFHRIDSFDPPPKGYLWLSITEGEPMPRLGFVEGNQTLLLSPMVNGAPGHTAHTLNILLRILGIPMMSNRYDRDHYVTINWKNIWKGMEHYLERMPEEAMLMDSEGDPIPYDFTSATHAPSNYLCADCSLGQQTVSPIQDHLWQTTLSMGHRTDLNPSDADMINSLYGKECKSRDSHNTYHTTTIRDPNA